MKRFIIYIIIISSIVLSQDTLSTKTFGDSLINDEGRSVQQTTEGGYINTGWIESYGDGEEEAAAELAIAKNTLVELAAELAAAEKAAAAEAAAKNNLDELSVELSAAKYTLARLSFKLVAAEKHASVMTAAAEAAAKLSAAENILAEIAVEKATRQAAAAIAAAEKADAKKHTKKATAELAAAKKAAKEAAAAIAAAVKAATEMAAAAKAAEEMAATAKVALAELTAELDAAKKDSEEAAAELAAAKIALAELAAEKAAAEKAAAEKVALEKAAQLAVDCQAKYNESTAAYEAGNLEANIALKREILGMSCDEELSSKVQYYIGWTYGNKLFDMDAAQAEYQKGANNYFSGLKYVEKCEEKLALYKKNDEAEAVYKAGDFAKSAVLREEVGLTKGCDKELAAKNLYLAGYIHQKKLNDNAKAKALYEIVVISFSGSRWVDKAKQKLADL